MRLFEFNLLLSCLCKSIRSMSLHRAALSRVCRWDEPSSLDPEFIARMLVTKGLSALFVDFLWLGGFSGALALCFAPLLIAGVVLGDNTLRLHAFSGILMKVA